MAEETKNELNLDAWDNLPLNPALDDWDDLPSGTAAAPEEEPPPSGGDREAGPETPRPAAVDDFGDPLEEESAAPETPPASPAFEAASPPLKTDPEPMSAEDIGDSADQTATSPAEQADDLDIQMLSSAVPSAAENQEALLPQKVELDLDGIFLDMEEQEPPPEEAAAEPEPEPTEALLIESDAVTEDLPPLEAVVVKKHPFKLFLIVAAAVLLLSAAGWAIYTGFFNSVEPPAVKPVQTAEAVPAALPPQAATPPHVAEPGDLRLEPFLVTIPDGDRGDQIVELEVVLHYKDHLDITAILAAETLLRDTIYRTAQNLGPRLGQDPDLETRLRQNLLKFVNEALGQPRVDYVQISLRTF